ncbi:Lrp/AsnC family transcriptional regulator [Microbacterium aurum]
MTVSAQPFVDAPSAGPTAHRSPAELDSLNRRLIDELQRNGRVAYAEVGRRLGVSEKTVRRRVLRLLEERSITIAAVTHPAALGFEAMALALIRVEGNYAPDRLAQTFAQFPEVDYVTVTTGPFAVQVELVGVDATELNAAVNDRIRPVPGVASVELLPYLRLHYQQARFAHEDRPADGIRPSELDHIDRAIINYLAEDGRSSFLQIADELSISEAKVRFRYGKLLESGAFRVMGIVNPLRLGYSYTSWILVKVGAGGRAQDVAEALTLLPAVSYVVLTAGRCDVLAEVVAVSGEELLTVLDEHIRAVPGVLQVESWVYSELHYKAVRPRFLAAAAHANDIQIV